MNRAAVSKIINWERLTRMLQGRYRAGLYNDKAVPEDARMVALCSGIARLAGHKLDPWNCYNTETIRRLNGV